jgi:hypothetical protein
VLGGSQATVSPTVAGATTVDLEPSMTLRPAGSSLRQCLQRLAALCLLPLGLSAQAQGVETLVTNAAIVDFEFDWGRA